MFGNINYGVPRSADILTRAARESEICQNQKSTCARRGRPTPNDNWAPDVSASLQLVALDQKKDLSDHALSLNLKE